MEQEIATNVWQMSGFIKSYTAGMLIFKDGKVSFLTREGEQFNAWLNEMTNIKWPSLQFGYGVHFDVNGKTYKMTFGQPAGEDSFDPGMITDFGRLAMGVSSIRGLMHLKDYKANANIWKEIFKKQ